MRGPRDTKAEAKGKQIWFSKENSGVLKRWNGLPWWQGQCTEHVCQGFTEAGLGWEPSCDVPSGWGLVPVHSESPTRKTIAAHFLMAPFHTNLLKKALTDFLEDFPFEDGSYY